MERPNVVPETASRWDLQDVRPQVEFKRYTAERPHDLVRLVVMFALLTIFGWVIVWATIQSSSSQWDRTKDMLQIILPALTGLIGSVLGFYFGSKSERLIGEKVSERYRPLDEVVPNAPGAHRSSSEPKLGFAASFQNIAMEVPDKDWECIPADLSKNVDHYLYGGQKSS